MKLGHSKDTISWSAYSLWKSSKKGYRQKYYGPERINFDNKETLFGKAFAEKMEADPTVIGSEKRCECDIGVKVHGFIDAFSDGTITEFKTGKIPWTQNKVNRHRQLDFYSMMIKEMTGEVNNLVYLKWFETRYKSTTYKGRTYVSDELELSGHEVTFERIVTDEDREYIKKQILKVCQEIEEDYMLYLKG